MDPAKFKVSFSIGEVSASLEVEDGPSIAFAAPDLREPSEIDRAFAKVIEIVRAESRWITKP